MYKHSPSRNQRSKGFKVKQVLQTCVLIAVCFWLIYQVKHSHDKKKEFEESDGSTSLETNSHGLKFGGRKGIQNPLEKKPLITAKKDEEEREEENGVEEDNSKHEKNVEEDDNKHEEEEEEQEQEQEQGKSEMEIEHEMDILNEERDREEVDENEDETKKEDVNHVEDHDHEAREEHYKGDDASSAVTHEFESLSAKTEKGNPENTIENLETKVLEDGKVSNNGEEVIAVKNTMGAEESLNVTTKEKEKSGDVSLKQDGTLVSNSTTTTKFNNEEETGTKLAKKSKETNDTPMMNSTKAKHKAAEGEMSTNPSLNNIRSDSNAEDTQNMETVLVELSNSSASSKTVVSEKEKINVNAEGDRDKNLELIKETSESETEEGGVDHHDPIDDSDTIVSLEKDVRTNLDTLPHIRTKESNKKEVAAK